MSYWSHNPELYDEIVTNALPTEWREKVENGEVTLYCIPQDIITKAATEGEREYWASRVDAAREQLKRRRNTE